MVRDEKRPSCDLRSHAYYQRAWMITRDCVRRDLGLWKRPLIRAYFEKVLQKTSWRRSAGRYRQGFYLEDSMCFAGRELSEAP
jgi:hypothetical protein